MQRDLQEAKTKSAQKMRTDYFKNNTGWSDVRGLYDSACQMLIGTGEIIRQGFSDRDIFKYFNNQEMVEVNTAINGMNKDLQLFTDELANIGNTIWISLVMSPVTKTLMPFWNLVRDTLISPHAFLLWFRQIRSS